MSNMFNLKTLLRRAAILLLMFAAFAVVAWYTGKNINKYNEEEFNRHLNIVMEQNVDTMTQSLGKHLTLVEGTAKRIAFMHENALDIRSFIDRQNSMQSLYGFLRIGFIYPDGRVIAPGVTGRLHTRDFFYKSMRGETVITPQLLNNVDDVQIAVNIISAPVKNDQGKVVGVVYEALPSLFMEEIMSRGFFAEFGSNALVNNNGEVLAADKNSELTGKYADLLPYVTVDLGHEKVTDWKLRVTGSNSVTMYFDRDGGQYLHFAPLLLEDRIEPIYIGILISKEFVENHTSSFNSYIFNQMFLIIMLAAVGFGYFIYDILRQERNNQHSLEQLAYTSRETGADNFASLVSRLSKTTLTGFIACFDVVEFATVKASFSAEKGNKLLNGIWEQIKANLEPEDMAGHVNNDRFAIFFAGTDIDKIVAKLHSINDSLADFSKRERVPKLTAVFGLAVYQPGDDCERAYNNANLAERAVLERNDRLYAIYGDNLTQNFAENSRFEREFEDNLAHGRFEVWYQPKLDIMAGCITGAEALIRLRTAEDELIMPNKFVPVFEKDGLIQDLDEYVFRRVCERQRERIDQGRRMVPVSVNLSRISLYSPEIVDRYAQIAAEIGIPVEMVPLEITETAYANIENIAQLLKKFVDKGFKLHMDDFGSGYSSLAAINELPFDSVKLDKSLIDFIGSDKGNNLLKHVVELSHERGMEIIAEGVEKQEQVDFLKTIKVKYIQGSYCGWAMQYSEFIQSLG